MAKKVSVVVSVLWASRLFFLCLGVLIGVALQLDLDFLGEIPESRVAAITSFLGAALAVAGSVWGAYSLWQWQVHRSEHSLGEAAAMILETASSGVRFLCDTLGEATEKEAGFLELPEGTVHTLISDSQALHNVTKDARINLQRISQSLGTLGAKRIPWFMIAERLVTNTEAFATYVSSATPFGSIDVNTRMQRVDTRFVARARAIANNLRIASEELRSERPSLDRFGEITESIE